MFARRGSKRGWGHLLDGRWITADDLADSGSVPIERRLDVPPRYPISVLLGPGERNLRAIEEYTGARILRKSGTGNYQYFILMGIAASVTLASVMISDFFVGGVEWVEENLSILCKVVGGEITTPNAYAQGWGLMSFFPEDGTSKDKQNLLKMVVSSPQKDRRVWPHLATQEEFESHYTLSANTYQQQKQSAIIAMDVTESGEDSGEDAVSVGPLDE